MIRIEGLQVQAGAFTLAIDELSVSPGSYLMVLGPTASGKTVLLEAIAGLRRPKAGRVWFGRRDVTAEPPEKRKVGLVYQSYALFPHLTVAGNVGFGLQRGSRGRVEDLASLLGITHLLDRYTDGLSGGEQQRVALARALALEPQVLLLDEPLSALDGATRLELQRELKRIHGQLGATVVHVTHDLDEAMALGDQMAVLMAGGLRQTGTPGLVTRFPADVEVATLVGAGNLLPVVETRPSVGGHRVVRLESGHELIAGSTAPSSQAAPTGRLWAVIRGEEIEIVPAEEPAESAAGAAAASAGSEIPVNLLHGIVREVQHQSVHARIEVEVPPPAQGGSLVLVVNALRPHVGTMALAAGSRVSLRVCPASIHVCGGGPA